MKYEKCETCGSIEYGKLGTLGVIGYSLIVGILGYALSQIFYANMIAPIVVILAVVLLLPVYVISAKEQLKEKRKNATEQK